MRPSNYKQHLFLKASVLRGHSIIKQGGYYVERTDQLETIEHSQNL